ncbi:MAG: HEPN domain-containing protein [Bacteroidales bacterium]|nr:HEPN domain-containing protein [Bacteroidales bacterium]
MTDKLDSQSRSDLIAYKLDKSIQTIQEAEVLANAGFYNASVNRLYYAAYYAASSLMLSEELETGTHKGTKTMLGLKFIHPGKLEREYGQIYQRLFDSRQAGDYEDFVYYDKASYDELRPLAEKFIERIRCYIVSQNN